MLLLLTKTINIFFINWNKAENKLLLFNMINI